MTWVREARCSRSGANAGERSAAPEPKTATVERREASVPRHGKCTLHKTPSDSNVRTLQEVSPFYKHSALLRSVVLHSYIADTRRTLEPRILCPSLVMSS